MSRSKRRKPTAEQAADAVIENDRMRRLEAYLRTGRRHAGLADAALDAQYIDSFRRMADDPFDAALREANGALELEFLARRREPPHDRLKPEIARFCAVVAELAEHQLENDPAGRVAFVERIGAEIEAISDPTADRSKVN